MDRSIEAVVHDLEIALARSAEIAREISTLDAGHRSNPHLLRTKELLADLRARLDGIETFVQNCQMRVHRGDEPPEDIDLWM
ncbi:MAG: hypothetical protein A2X67_07455 [Ignavibacteria bacterium GWA2_55_11]|nr:MAG: hypothetical protein A2X67_07455 [Ignavibacteria bacterium GWA2_55_11]OGU66241.1 MAG: hypothetical protein A3C56_08240 [Ignavibacteria bacterium RIFCSPHIGHO2_02_FULL_56_12]OGU69913.1 MAG: hypothetical protein A3H45_07470 [Ignavibacteria bacterium RIFCSPLOWO2_02_FULL_55_14]HAV22980.1 hypothetical protein [Bacteroidota bacterium]